MIISRKHSTLIQRWSQRQRWIRVGTKSKFVDNLYCCRNYDNHILTEERQPYFNVGQLQKRYLSWTFMFNQISTLKQRQRTLTVNVFSKLIPCFCVCWRSVLKIFDCHLLDPVIRSYIQLDLTDLISFEFSPQIRFNI